MYKAGQHFQFLKESESLRIEIGDIYEITGVDGSRVRLALKDNDYAYLNFNSIDNPDPDKNWATLVDLVTNVDSSLLEALL